MKPVFRTQKINLDLMSMMTYLNMPFGMSAFLKIKSFVSFCPIQTCHTILESVCKYRFNEHDSVCLATVILFILSSAVFLLSIDSLLESHFSYPVDHICFEIMIVSIEFVHTFTDFDLSDFLRTLAYSKNRIFPIRWSFRT